MASTNTSTAAAKRYATALIDTAQAAQSIDSIEKDIADLRKTLEGSADFQTFVKSPLVKEAEQGAVINAVADKAGFHVLTRNFLLSLVKNRRLPMLAQALKAVQGEISRRRGEVEASVQAAYALTPAQTKDLQAAISQALGTNVTMNVSINKDLIGGLVVQVGSTLVDASVKNKIERLARAMMRGKAA